MELKSFMLLAESTLKRAAVMLNLGNALLTIMAVKERQKFMCTHKSCAEWGRLSVGGRLLCQEHGQAQLALSSQYVDVYPVPVNPLAGLLDLAIDEAIFHCDDDEPIPYSLTEEETDDRKKCSGKDSGDGK